jgi:hypothetical protein
MQPTKLKARTVGGMDLVARVRRFRRLSLLRRPRTSLELARDYSDRPFEFRLNCGMPPPSWNPRGYLPSQMVRCMPSRGVRPSSRDPLRLTSLLRYNLVRVDSWIGMPESDTTISSSSAGLDLFAAAHLPTILSCVDSRFKGASPIRARGRIVGNRRRSA